MSTALAGQSLVAVTPQVLIAHANIDAFEGGAFDGVNSGTIGIHVQGLGFVFLGFFEYEVCNVLSSEHELCKN